MSGGISWSKAVEGVMNLLDVSTSVENKTFGGSPIRNEPVRRVSMKP
jgi:hypothetical protein